MTTIVRLCLSVWCLWYTSQFVHWTVVVSIGALAIANEVAAWSALDLRKRVKRLEGHER